MEVCMIKHKSGMNRLQNTRNEHQGDSKKVLCVCSAGLLRSPTLAELLVKEYGHNTRACGSNHEYALIPIDDALIFWANEIVFVNQENYEEACLRYADELSKKKVFVLNVTDRFAFRDNELKEQLLTKYKGIIDADANKT